MMPLLMLSPTAMVIWLFEYCLFFLYLVVKLFELFDIFHSARIKKKDIIGASAATIGSCFRS